MFSMPALPSNLPPSLARLAASALLLSGCATIPAYTPATGPDTAKLRLKLSEPLMSYTALLAIDTDTCRASFALDWLSGAASDAVYATRVGMMDSSPPREGLREFVIAANKPIAAYPNINLPRIPVAETLLTAGKVKYGELDPFKDRRPAACVVPGFLPKAGQEYEVVFDMAPGKCDTRIYQLQQDGSQVLRTDISANAGVTVAADEKTQQIACKRR